MARVRVQVPVDQTAEHQPEFEPAGEHQHNTPVRLFNRNNAAIGLLILIVLIVVTSLLNDRKKLENKVNQLSTSQGSNAQTDTQKYQDAVSKLVEVPANITPAVSILTPDSIKQLPNESILQTSAKAGDVILLYKVNESNSFVVMYRPSNNRVVLATASTSNNSSNSTKP